MDLHLYSMWDQAYVADPDSAHDGEDAAGSPERFVDAWGVSRRGVAYWPIPVTSNLWEQAQCGPVPDVVRAVIEGQAIEWWREHVGEWHTVG